LRVSWSPAAIGGGLASVDDAGGAGCSCVGGAARSEPKTQKAQWSWCFADCSSSGALPAGSSM
jgi:hypothetical protein